MGINLSKFFFSFFLIVVSCFFLAGCAPTQKSLTITEEKPVSEGDGEKMEIKKNQKKVLLVIAPAGFQDDEFKKPKAILENSGFKTVVASKGVKTALGALGTAVTVDQQLTEVQIDDFEALIFVGGPGSSIYFTDQTVLTLAKAAHQKEKVVGAICIAPSILANAGVLKGKNATVFPSETENLKAKGAIYTGDQVTVDEKIVTASGPSAAEEFAKKIVELLARS